jgi:hypothetical protein
MSARQFLERRASGRPEFYKNVAPILTTILPFNQLLGSEAIH